MARDIRTDFGTEPRNQGLSAFSRTHSGTHVLVRVLVNDLQVTIINAATGELLRELTIYTSPDYQPTGRPKGPQKNRKPPNH